MQPRTSRETRASNYLAARYPKYQFAQELLQAWCEGGEAAALVHIEAAGADVSLLAKTYGVAALIGAADDPSFSLSVVGAQPLLLQKSLANLEHERRFDLCWCKSLARGIADSTAAARRARAACCERRDATLALLSLMRGSYLPELPLEVIDVIVVRAAGAAPCGAPSRFCLEYQAERRFVERAACLFAELHAEYDHMAGLVRAYKEDQQADASWRTDLKKARHTACTLGNRHKQHMRTLLYTIRVAAIYSVHEANKFARLLLPGRLVDWSAGPVCVQVGRSGRLPEDGSLASTTATRLIDAIRFVAEFETADPQGLVDFLALSQKDKPCEKANTYASMLLRCLGRDGFRGTTSSEAFRLPSGSWVYEADWAGDPVEELHAGAVSLRRLVGAEYDEFELSKLARDAVLSIFNFDPFPRRAGRQQRNRSSKRADT